MSKQIGQNMSIASTSIARTDHRNSERPTRQPLLQGCMHAVMQTFVKRKKQQQQQQKQIFQSFICST